MSTSSADPTVGVLALQGAFAAHIRALTDVGARACEVRTPADLDGVDALVMPGGESTTMSRLLTTTGLFDAISGRLDGGMPVFGTCAGLILLASMVLDGRPDQRSFAAIELTVRRNGYGRQIDSFESDLEVAGLSGQPFHAVFIRAPRIEAVGPDVEVLASYDGEPVLVRSGAVMAAAFHPELSGDHRLHSQFVQQLSSGV